MGYGFAFDPLLPLPALIVAGVVTLLVAALLIVSRSRGARAGLRALAGIEGHPALGRYHLLPTTLGMLWRESGNPGKAADYFRQALECACSAPERRFLERQLAALQEPA